MRIGDKVVCVDDAWRFAQDHVQVLPKKGQVYVIRSIRCCGVLLLVGVRGDIVDGRCSQCGVINRSVEFGFRPGRFRLLDEIKQQNQAKQHAKP